MIKIGGRKGCICILVVIMTWLWMGGVCKAVDIGEPRRVNVKRCGDESLRLKWSKVKYVDGYIIYKYNRLLNKYEKYRIIKKRNILSMVDKVGENKSAKYKVAAYRRINGKKVVGRKSHFVCARTYVKGDKKVNVGQVKIKIVGSGYQYAEIAYHEAIQLSAKVKASSYSKAKNKVVLSKKVRWYSSDTDVVRIDKKGHVIARTKQGECYVFAKAHNGKKSNKIRIVVENYAKPKKITTSLWAAAANPNKYGQTLEMFNRYYNDVTNIAEYFSVNRLLGNETYECWMENGKVIVNTNKAVSEEIQQLIYKFIKNFPYNIRLKVTSEYVAFTEVYEMSETNKKDIMNVVYTYDMNKINPYRYTEKYVLNTNWVYGYLY